MRRDTNGKATSRMYIEHPAVQGENVGLVRWLKYHLGVWLGRIGYRWEDNALYPDRCPECGQRKPRWGECDHIPF